MGYDESKLARLKHLKELATKVATDYTLKKDFNALSSKVNTLEQAGGQPNVLDGVKVNGTALDIADKMVDILIATGTANGTLKVNGVDVSVQGLAAMAYKAEISETELSTALAQKLNAKADAATTLDGYGITDAYTKEAIDAKISSVYKPAGSVAFASLPTLSVDVLGNVYNVTDAFTSTESFVEGTGKKHPAGTNVVVVQAGEEFKFDVLAGFVDLSDYEKTANTTEKLAKKADKVSGAASGNFAGLDESGNLTDSGKKAADFVAAQDGHRLMTDAEGTKLGGIAEGATKVESSTTAGNIKINGVETTVVVIASDEEATAMLDEVFAAKG